MSSPRRVTTRDHSRGPRHHARNAPDRAEHPADESRHEGYGVYLLSRLVAEEGEGVWEQTKTQMAGLLMNALSVVAEMLAPYENDVLFGLTVNPFLACEQGQFQKRHARFDKARSKTLGEIVYGVPGRSAAMRGDGARQLRPPQGPGQPNACHAVSRQLDERPSG